MGTEADQIDGAGRKELLCKKNGDFMRRPDHAFGEKDKRHFKESSNLRLSGQEIKMQEVWKMHRIHREIS